MFCSCLDENESLKIEHATKGKIEFSAFVGFRSLFGSKICQVDLDMEILVLVVSLKRICGRILLLKVDKLEQFSMRGGKIEKE